MSKDLDADFLSQLQSNLRNFSGEVTERNEDIADRDEYIYSDKLERSLDIPIGHDFTPVNWLRRTVEIHKTMFMGRPFQVLSNYDAEDLSMAVDQEDLSSKELQNKKEKAFAEERKRLIDGIIHDNGGHALFSDGAESASATGTWIVKTYYDKENNKFVVAPVEAVENCFVLWNKDDFRQYDVFAYAHQVSKIEAVESYGAPDDVATSPSGSPFLFSSGSAGIENAPIKQQVSSNTALDQPMVTILEATGRFEGWRSESGRLAKAVLGDETLLNVTFVGNKLTKLVSKEGELPRYYIYPNKRERRRPWGASDISDGAIMLNLTYIETLSDWRTVASKINFPKFKGFNFGPDTQTPKFKPRSIQLLPLSEGQDMTLLQAGDANSIDWGRQLDEIQKQFIRETGISRVLFDDPDVTLNSNQALLTSMKPTSDIAENKKQLWAPILSQMFTDAINTIAMFRTDVKDLASGNWSLKIQWPSVMQKEDPVFQQMLLNRWNAGTLSLQSYLEMQGEDKEEIDRMRDEMTDAITAAALGKALPALAQYVLGLPAATGEVANAVSAANPTVATPANNVPGTGPVSQPNAGAPPVSPQGALNQNQATQAITGPQGATLQASSFASRLA